MSYFISSRTSLYSSPKREGEKERIFFGCHMVFGGGGGTGGGLEEEQSSKNDGGRRGEGGFIRMLQGL